MSFDVNWATPKINRLIIWCDHHKKRQIPAVFIWLVFFAIRSTMKGAPIFYDRYFRVGVIKTCKYFDLMLTNQNSDWKLDRSSKGRAFDIICKSAGSLRISFIGCLKSVTTIFTIFPVIYISTKNKCMWEGTGKLKNAGSLKTEQHAGHKVEFLQELLAY